MVIIAYFNFNYGVCKRREELKEKGGMEGTKERKLAFPFYSLTVICPVLSIYIKMCDYLFVGDRNHKIQRCY